MERSHLDGLDDAELVRLHQADPDGRDGRLAAEVLLLRWRKRILLWCYRMVRDWERAADLTQESLVRIYQALPRFESRAAVSSWMFSIVRNRCLSALRSRPLRRDPDVDLEELSDPLSSHEETADQRDLLNHVVGVMEETLEPIEQRALWLRAHEGMSVEDITRLLELPGASGARSLLQTARAKLRAALARRPRGHGEGA